jgi:YD repeat-containing protein
LGNGTTETLTFDGRYRPGRLRSGPLDLTYDFDDANNVSGVTDTRDGHSATYTYDALNQLKTVTGFGAMTFDYDALSNRTVKSFGTSLARQATIARRLSQ